MGEAGGGGGNATQRDPGYGKSDFVRLRALKLRPVATLNPSLIRSNSKLKSMMPIFC